MSHKTTRSNDNNSAGENATYITAENVTMRPSAIHWTHQLDWFGKQHFEQDVDRPKHTGGDGLKQPMNDVQRR